MKKGFTLMELLLVLVIVSVVGVGASIAFDRIDESNSVNELVEKYEEIERAAKLYVDIDDDYLTSLVSGININGTEYSYVFIPISKLYNEKYITNVKDPTTNDDNLISYYAIVYITKDSNDNEIVSSCIVNTTESKDTNKKDRFYIKGLLHDENYDCAVTLKGSNNSLSDSNKASKDECYKTIQNTTCAKIANQFVQSSKG